MSTIVIPRAEGKKICSFTSKLYSVKSYTSVNEKIYMKTKKGRTTSEKTLISLSMCPEEISEKEGYVEIIIKNCDFTQKLCVMYDSNGLKSSVTNGYFHVVMYHLKNVKSEAFEIIPSKTHNYSDGDDVDLFALYNFYMQTLYKKQKYIVYREDVVSNISSSFHFGSLDGKDEYNDLITYMITDNNKIVEIGDIRIRNHRKFKHLIVMMKVLYMKLSEHFDMLEDVFVFDDFMRLRKHVEEDHED